MFLIAWRNLFQEKTRLLISVGGVAFSIVLIMMLTGLYRGWNDKMGQYIRSVPADLWVMQDGTEDMFHTPSLLPLSLADELTKINGVDSAKPFNARRLVVSVNGQEFQLYIVGYNSATDAGRPARITRGKSVPGPGEIIIDHSQSKKVNIGDRIDAAGRQLKVVGFSEGGDLVITSFAFTSPEELDKIQKLPDAVSQFWVTISPGADSNKVISNIEAALPDVAAVTRAQFVKNNTKIVSDSFLPVILILVLVSIAVGIAVIGLTIFTSTVEKSKEYGVLKAIGLNNQQLYGIVTRQAMVAGAIGFAIGTGLAFGLSATVGKYVPQFVSQIRAVDVAWILLLTLTMSVLAAFMPTRRLARIDPAEVFKA
ncbi:FtsX-like permease family protein [Candidatus Saccharibacteria bacterium]|nr:FtsX-like permease family protein [Candidatus Saccharibacteria bacterium]